MTQSHLLVAALAAFATLSFGCSQKTEAPVGQPIRQEQSPQTDQAAQGSASHVNVWIQNAPDNAGQPASRRVLDALLTPDKATTMAGADSTDGGGSLRDSRAGFVQGGITLNIHTGGSTTGAQATGPISGQTATPAASINQYPTQKPEAAFAVPVTVAMPGGAATGNASGASGGGTATLDAQTRNELRTLYERALAGDQSARLRLAELLLGGGTPAPPAATQPATP